MDASDESDASETKGFTIPVVVDLGSRKRKRIKQLKRGEGPLVDEVYEAVEAVLEELGEGDDQTIVPVVLLYKQKRKKRKQRGLFFPFR